MRLNRTTRLGYFYGFLVVIFLDCTFRSQQSLSSLRCLRPSAAPQVAEHEDGGNDNDSDSNTQDNPSRRPRPFDSDLELADDNKDYNGDAYAYAYLTNDGVVRFRNGDALELGKLQGKGGITYAFRALWHSPTFQQQHHEHEHGHDHDVHPKTVIAKIDPDGDMMYSHMEVDVFAKLLEAPSIPNIPVVHFAVRSAPNPFWNATHLEEMGVNADRTRRLLKARRVAFLVMECLDTEASKGAETVPEIRKLIRSLLETMQFAHSRNVMHRDLHNSNYFWDGERVSLFDWNMAEVYVPGRVRVHHDNAPEGLFPPEARDNSSAIHTSVHAYDVYTIGKLLRGLAKGGCCGSWEDFEKDHRRYYSGKNMDKDNKNRDEKNDGSIDNDTERNETNTDQRRLRELQEKDEKLASRKERALLYDLAMYMMTPDPYQRPDTTKALWHPFFYMGMGDDDDDDARQGRQMKE
mmetsp:Transcript_19378/g.44956  ORF Transcript_19378/g.44956 Transcript_19378/m.44956 type:complete len:463 (-) Transcript_19378:246-1634(-)|eukprot:CAMPEP_0172385068 /NCGR_PEP_ID=MMETSP1061-20121228/2736_1 /TAXON_ID=37318 /ORGANISM="Pseudo-nitzschia pungens, Strain cf. pungens" /LENGTH=462 /DNA_ID=CAMNT_0013113913 /DNA_START=347 /DNA_END=1735 /DNA_ORIENTATION=+